MARGCAKLFGYELPENFRLPYLARNPREFWRRWHITLSTWLRDYLYISLGGNRRSKHRMYTNLMITMALGGLWHGAAWTFFIWGVYHGLLLVIHRKVLEFCEGVPSLEAFLETRLGEAVSVATTFLLVTLGWVFFRADTFQDALSVFAAMAAPLRSGPVTEMLLDSRVSIFAACLVLYHVLRVSLRRFAGFTPFIRRVWTYTAVSGVLLSVIYFTNFYPGKAEEHPEPFIYFPVLVPNGSTWQKEEKCGPLMIRRQHRSGSKARISRWKCVVALLLILLLGASLRFYRITELEPGIQDEASYLLEARFLSSFCAAVWDSARLVVKEKMSGEDLWKREEQLPGIRDRYKGPAPSIRTHPPRHVCGGSESSGGRAPLHRKRGKRNVRHPDHPGGLLPRQDDVRRSHRSDCRTDLLGDGLPHPLLQKLARRGGHAVLPRPCLLLLLQESLPVSRTLPEGPGPVRALCSASDSPCTIDVSSSSD